MGRNGRRCGPASRRQPLAPLKVRLAVLSCAGAALLAAGGGAQEPARIDALLRLPAEEAPPAGTWRPPFSFLCGGRPAAEVLALWRQERTIQALPGQGTRVATTWADPATGLLLRWEATRFSDFPAVEWLLFLENGGKADSPIVEDLQALDAIWADPHSSGAPYILHRTNGAPADPTDFAVERLPVGPKDPRVLGGGGGRSSNRDLPFFKVEAGSAAWIVAVGWSGQWQARLECPDASTLRLRAGLERSRFSLHPGERVRTPRILLLRWEGGPVEANVRFRRLIYRHYAARRNGQDPLPILFANTCFTRGEGSWLNECNAENQISLIRAYAPLGLEAVVTDAGWFEGGWPRGIGNWMPRRDAYPEGIGPVARAAAEHGLAYGLWFEPERVMAGTWIHRHHPEWCLSAASARPGTFLLDLGNPEAREHIFQVVKGFMDLPGFRFYRQDFNLDPLPFWRANDRPDREGMTEMRYIAGLYELWDRIAAAWPDSIREECASGGRRIDLETVSRFHLHQDSDQCCDDDVDQTQIFGLSQYLPNNLFATPITRLDSYTFHSTLAASLCVGWIADAPGFDTARASALLDRYRELRPLLVGEWYPLLPSTRDPGGWMASQYHRPDLGRGMVLAFRRAESPFRTVEVSLHGLDPGADYELVAESTGERIRRRGEELRMKHFISIPAPRRSELLVYRRVDDGKR